jgi:hypothetical protein
MAAYKEEAGAILQPGNQINRLSSYNTEGVYGWPGAEAFELVGYIKIDNLAADKANYKSFNITIPSPDRRPDDRVRDNRTSLVVQASSTRPAYVYGASLALAEDIPSGGLAGFPASPVTCGLQGTDTEVLLLGPDNSGNPFGIPSSQVNGLAAASSSLTIGATGIAQGTSAVTSAGLPFLNVVEAATTDTSAAKLSTFANQMMYKVTSDTTFKVYNLNAVTNTTITGDGVNISSDDSTAGKAAYLLCRVNYIRPASAVSWNDIQGFIDFASQVGGTDS